MPERRKEAKRSRAGRKYDYIPRDPAATKKRILDAAVAEFAEKGFSGARVESIAKTANANMRLLYHYFHDKEQLYIAVIEEVYRDVRSAEQDLHIEEDDPKKGLERLVDFTFTHFAEHPDLIRIVMNENIQRATYLKKSDLVPMMTTKLSSSVKSLLDNGYETGVFRRKPDPIQLWLSIFSLCWVHLANKHTMSWTLQVDLTDTQWLESRRRHVLEVIMCYLCAPTTS
ncbi:TetR/AcrR family transcriptional regulator [Pseudaminobacter sp. 19-2017]|uniref:TetR/AcrR family transcriptional regulator n=1 Tax=Pseudaminobacter soli (ex Zhang et al. 2022) TaxID=2831468 RepID=A0A942E641_9HYPH|nr:TetR/AcrR family transcriptional regulator [Pseudaminobacter soli]MBS3651641.1 TetR/AcrR family transcriptional regulator [Pseudaminobacter soli]